MFPCICLVCTHPLPCWGRFHRGLPSLDLASENSSIHLWRCSEALEPGSAHSQTWYSSSSHGYLRVSTQTQRRKVVNNQGETERNNEEDWQRQSVRLSKENYLICFFLGKVKWEGPHYCHVCPLNVRLQLEADWCRIILVHMWKHIGQ